MPLPRKAIDPMQKTIPRNPRYNDIGPTVDTGASLSKYLKKMEEFRENFRFRDDEIFRRIKLSTFVQLILQIYETREQSNRIETFDRQSEVSTDGNGHSNGTVESKRRESGDGSYLDPPPTARSTLENLVHGVGEFDTNANFQQYCEQSQGGGSRPSSAIHSGQTGDSEMPYLLLDLRDREEYDACHIITALNYPIAMLSRSVNFETMEMLAFRNKPGCIIVVYDEDERIGPRAATTLVQRGYQNVFLLSGGLRLAWKNFPEGLIIGEMPASIRQSLKSKQRERAPAWSPQLERINSASTLGTAATSNNCSTRVRDLPRTPIIYCQPGSRDNADGVEEFLCEDILKLSLSMEKTMDDGRSIRTGCTRSSVNTARRSSSNLSIHKKPFR